MSSRQEMNRFEERLGRIEGRINAIIDTLGRSVDRLDRMEKSRTALRTPMPATRFPKVLRSIGLAPPKERSRG